MSASYLGTWPGKCVLLSIKSLPKTAYSKTSLPCKMQLGKNVLRHTHPDRETAQNAAAQAEESTFKEQRENHCKATRPPLCLLNAEVIHTSGAVFAGFKVPNNGNTEVLSGLLGKEFSHCLNPSIPPTALCSRVLKVLLFLMAGRNPLPFTSINSPHRATTLPHHILLWLELAPYVTHPPLSVLRRGVSGEVSHPTIELFLINTLSNFTLETRRNFLRI